LRVEDEWYTADLMTRHCQVFVVVQFCAREFRQSSLLVIGLGQEADLTTGVFAAVVLIRSGEPELEL
jgi:hypothetical protein